MVRHCSWGQGRDTWGLAEPYREAYLWSPPWRRTADAPARALTCAACNVHGCGCVAVRGCVPSRCPRAHVTGRRALSLLLRGHMWAHLRKPTAGRSQRVGLVKRRGSGRGGGAAGRRGGGAAGRREAPSVRGLPEGLVHTGLVQWAAHSLTHNLRSHPPGAWGRVRRCDAWRVRGESGMPIRVEYALCSRRDATS